MTKSPMQRVNCGGIKAVPERRFHDPLGQLQYHRFMEVSALAIPATAIMFERWIEIKLVHFAKYVETGGKRTSGIYGKELQNPGNEAKASFEREKKKVPQHVKERKE